MVNCWEGPCTSSTEWKPWTVRASTRKPVWIQKGQRNNWHDLHSKAASREMPGIEHGPLHDLCWPYQSIWYSQSWGSLENYGEIWLSDQAHSNDKFIGEAVTRWYACTARVQNNGASSDPFPVTNNVKQGCVLAPTLFSMMFSAMLTTAFQDEDNGIPIRYRFWWEAFQPKKVASQMHGADRGARRVPLCRWYGKGCSNRKEDAKKV